MGNSKHMLFWGFKTFLLVGGSTQTTKIGTPVIISELTSFIVKGLKRRILYQVKECQMVL